MIPVTKPFLPPYQDYERYTQGIWERNWLTNNGPLVNELESNLRAFFGCENFLFLGNGTIAIQLAIKALELKGEVITTPFSYVATTSSIVWEGCEPIFVDVDPLTLNIDPSKIEASITKDTTAILATHCFGNACDIDKIDKIAKTYGLKVIYDAAHCFGSMYKGESIFKYGDVSTVSFHATKIFHTVEGGGVIAQNKELFERLFYMRNFGHKNLEEFQGLGINAKNSEFHAAMGLANLKYIQTVLEKRKEQYIYYDTHLILKSHRRVERIDNSSPNYSYYPIVFETEQRLLIVLTELNKSGIFPRRYFYPSLSSLPYVKGGKLPVTDDECKKVLCLPLYHTLTFSEMNRIIEILNKI